METKNSGKEETPHIHRLGDAT